MIAVGLIEGVRRKHRQPDQNRLRQLPRREELVLYAESEDTGLVDNLNEWLFELINGCAGRSDAVDALAKFASDKLLFVLAAMLGVLGLRELRRSRPAGLRTLALAVVSIGLSLVLTLLLKQVFSESRPFVSENDVHLLVRHSADASFPSNHATIAGAAGMLGALLWPRFAPLTLGTAVLVALARVWVGIHYPGDVLAGLALGMASAWAIWILSRWLRRSAVRSPTMLA